MDRRRIADVDSRVATSSAAQQRDALGERLRLSDQAFVVPPQQIVRIPVCHWLLEHPSPRASPRLALPWPPCAQLLRSRERRHVLAS